MPRIIDSPSPNQGERPAGVKPSLVVIHGTVGTDNGDLLHLRSAKSKASYHYLIQRTGTIYRLVRPEKRAWHAGDSEWRGVRDVNDYSIGIGLSNLDSGEPYTEAQYAAAGWLCAIFEREYGIGMEQVVGHCHVSPGRKTDPWLNFEWGRLFARMEASRL
jgi:N-acetylmuramoyl-L-alanine amidase